MQFQQLSIRTIKKLLLHQRINIMQSLQALEQLKSKIRTRSAEISSLSEHIRMDVNAIEGIKCNCYEKILVPIHNFRKYYNDFAYHCKDGWISMCQQLIDITRKIVIVYSQKLEMSSQNYEKQIQELMKENNKIKVAPMVKKQHFERLEKNIANKTTVMGHELKSSGVTSQLFQVEEQNSQLHSSKHLQLLQSAIQYNSLINPSSTTLMNKQRTKNSKQYFSMTNSTDLRWKDKQNSYQYSKKKLKQQQNPNHSSKLTNLRKHLFSKNKSIDRIYEII